VTLEDGSVWGFYLEAGNWESVELNPSQLSAGQPPLLYRNGPESFLLHAPSTSASPWTHPIPYFRPGFLQVFLEGNGNLVSVDLNQQLAAPLELNALPDARILQDHQGQLLLLTGPTRRYDHGVLGDALEASSFTLITNLDAGQQTTISMPGDFVIEGIAPIWVDWNGDGNREIIITVSDANQGAQIRIFDESGEQIAAGPAIGQGYRWRHQIATAPFGPAGEIELAEVLTPHLGGIVGFYRWEGSQLKIVAQVPGYTSHVIGTRNLDMAAAGDFDGDGRVELLLPRQDRRELGAIRRTASGAVVAWSLPLESAPSTNIGAVQLADGTLAIGVGQENGILTLWHP
jgi:hypothetical protein